MKRRYCENSDALAILEEQALRLGKEELTRGAPPFDPWRVARDLGVYVESTPLSGIDGYVERRGESLTIILNALAPRYRARFTLAHEIGHILLARWANNAGRFMRFRANGIPAGTSFRDPEEERLCNKFAAAFLMPSSEIREVIARHGVTIDSVDCVRQRFGVSSWAASTAVLDVVGARDTGVALWDVGTPWPVPRWWIGLRAEPAAPTDHLEALLAAAPVGLGCHATTLQVRGRQTNVQAEIRRNACYALMILRRMAPSQSRWDGKADQIDLPM
jgi:Zn-dependent peptidase ImmA (M78 family)